MSNTREYNFVLSPLRKYATFPCNEAFVNKNFDGILLDLGKYYFHRPDAKENQICSLIKDELNKEWHLNRIRNYKKRVSTAQIKSIRRSFNRLVSNTTHVRIPFDVVPILFYILSLYKSIDSDNATIQTRINAMNVVKIGDYLYSDHTIIFNSVYPTRKPQITETELIEKYKRLDANLNHDDSIMRITYNDIKWNSIDTYRL